MRLVVSLLILLALATAVHARPVIVRDGQGRADIVVSADPPRMARLAASQLQEYLRRITGAELPIVTEPMASLDVHLYVGASDAARMIGVTDEGLKHGAFRMVSGDNWLALVGCDDNFQPPPEPWAHTRVDRARQYEEWDRITSEKWGLPYPLRSIYKSFNAKLDVSEYDQQGSLNAVNAYLRSLGVRWYMPGEENAIVPTRRTLLLPEVDRTVRPDFAVRWWHLYQNRFNMADREEAMWQLRLGLNRAADMLGLAAKGHGIVWVISRDETKQQHPEFYALWGKRAFDGHGKPCLSPPGLLEQNVRHARAIFDHYQAPWISVMPSDGYSYLCQCALCRGKDTPERGYRGRLSDYVWGYVNRVADRLYETHPDRKVICHAYGTYLKPLLKINSLSPNVVVGFCQWRGIGFDPETRRRLVDLRDAWRQKMHPDNMLLLWEYYLHGRPDAYGWDTIPVVFPDLIAEDLRSLKGQSYGEYVEIYRRPSERNDIDLATNHLNLYVTSRLYWNVDEDVDPLLSEYYDLFYGPAATQARAFFEFCRHNWFKMKGDVGSVDEMFSLLDAARQAAGETIYGERLARIADYTAPLKERVKNIAPGGDKEYVTRINSRRAHAVEGTTDQIVFDGKLGDEFWKTQRKYLLLDCVTGANPEKNVTIVRVGWADDAIYFGIRCYDDDMDNLVISGKDDGAIGIWWGDCIDILLETHGHAYYQVQFNPAGVMTDFDRADGLDAGWSSGAEVAVHHYDNRWTAEVRIPVISPDEGGTDLLQGVDEQAIAGVVGSKPNSALPWYFNVCRQRVRPDQDNEYQAFGPTGEPSFHVREKFGELYVK